MAALRFVALRCWRRRIAVASAQTPGGPPNALQGFSQNRDKPVKIDAASLEVRDKNKIATFSGNVQVVQGDTTLRCKTLVGVLRSGPKAGGNALTAAKPRPRRASSASAGSKRKGDVVVTQKDQIATGETGIFDMASNTVTLSGNVVVTQGQNVLKRRASGGRSDHRRLAGRIRQRRTGPGAGTVPAVERARLKPGAGDAKTSAAMPSPSAATGSKRYAAAESMQPAGLY